MSSRKQVELECDWPSCYVTLETRAATVAEARRRAREAGWGYSDGLDLCGPPSAEDLDRRDRWRHLSSVGSRIPADHATQFRAGPHRPDPEVSTSGGFRARCSCGWRPERALWTDRRGAHQTWLWEHWRDEVKADDVPRQGSGMQGGDLPPAH